MLTDSTRRRDFPALEGITYLNTAAESIPPLCVGEAIQTYWRDKERGMKGRDAHFAQVEACREVTARMIGLEPSEVSFCSCSSEAYNLLASALNLGATDEVAVTDLDFPAGATPWLTAIESPQTRLWKARDGELQVEDLLPLLNERTRLVQVSLVSFYNGHRLAWRPFCDAVRNLAPQALISVDVTQALGRVLLDCVDADIVISSTHKWTLGIHGGGIIGIPQRNASRLTTHAGGWYHLRNAFDADRFERADTKTGAASFSVGMPNFVSLYALNASLRYLEDVGIENIVAHADPLTAEVEAGLKERGLQPLCPWRADNPSGIVAFKHPDCSILHAALEHEHIHIMHQAGRIRIAVHGYNTQEDVGNLLRVLETILRKV
ncbi:aminotransferase class V-fold PLP-dependent enzyme [Verrucomicrobium sp. BvORR034]|uniref:aminotransferase class V-fold PLP-dependent enzyme n=1 Tax=Verrucomicrobium sp. BvORR034 TaxID=1396418 RepID=UPI0006790C78|nr:aminotransferase class V-fold PLP-dependent enzyme [Verrucomicrobium sp. BvORR034]